MHDRTVVVRYSLCVTSLDPRFTRHVIGIIQLSFVPREILQYVFDELVPIRPALLVEQAHSVTKFMRSGTWLYHANSALRYILLQYLP